MPSHYHQALDTFPYTLDRQVSGGDDVVRTTLVPESDPDLQFTPVPPADPTAFAPPKQQRVESLRDAVNPLICGTQLALLVLVLVKTMWFQGSSSIFAWRTAPLVHTPYFWPLAFVSVTLYIIYVKLYAPYYAKYVYLPPSHPVGAEREAMLKGLLQVWNLGLAFLSLCMLLGMGIPLIIFMFEHPTVFENICDPVGSRWDDGGSMFFWIYVFTFSKVAELIDTVFLVLRNKPVNFLHWYHHVTVLLYCWLGCINRYPPGWYFALINSGVHTLMYWYYFRAACGVRLTYDKLTTTIQISQMVFGILITSVWTAYWALGYNCPVGQPYEQILASVVMYGSYLVLFGSFYYNRYVKKQATNAAATKTD